MVSFKYTCIFSKASSPFLGHIQPFIHWIPGTPSPRPRSHVPIFDRRVLTGRQRAQLGTLIIFPVLTGQSNDQERCNQSVVHAPWLAKDHNSVIALFLLYRRRKRRRNRLNWVHPLIQKKGRIRCFVHTIWWTTRWRKHIYQLFSNVSFISRRVASPIEGESWAS
jgi:hypothetical protein